MISRILSPDIVFWLDSVLTAVSMAEHLPVMIAAVVIAILVMLPVVEPVGTFVNAHPTVNMLALAFLILIGVAPIADGLELHIPRGYLYFAVAFSAGVGTLNLLARRRRGKAPALACSSSSDEER